MLLDLPWRREAAVPAASSQRAPAPPRAAAGRPRRAPPAPRASPSTRPAAVRSRASGAASVMGWRSKSGLKGQGSGLGGGLGLGRRLASQRPQQTCSCSPCSRAVSRCTRSASAAVLWSPPPGSTCGATVCGTARHGRGWYGACTVRGPPGARCPVPLVRTVRSRLVRVPSAYSREVPGRTCQHRGARSHACCSALPPAAWPSPCARRRRPARASARRVDRGCASAERRAGGAEWVQNGCGVDS